MMIVTDEQVKQQWYDHLTNEYELQVIVLAQYHQACTHGLSDVDYDDAENDYDSEHYLVYTDEEADEAVREHIEEMVWAFTPSFLRTHTGLTIDVIAKLQEMCEDANEPLTLMIKDFDHFVDDAVSCDGRGHFLAQYDHEENKITFNGVDYYIYRRE